MSGTTVLKNGRASVDDDECSSCACINNTPQNVTKVRDAILQDRRRTIYGICNIVDLSFGVWQRIMSGELNTL